MLKTFVVGQLVVNIFTQPPPPPTQRTPTIKKLPTALLILTGPIHRRHSFQRTMMQSDLLTLPYILIPSFIKSCHWALLVLTSLEKIVLYFNSLLSFSNPTSVTKICFSFKYFVNITT